MSASYRRLGSLVILLIILLSVFVLTAGWRRRVLAKSGRYRQIGAALQTEDTQQRIAALESAVRSDPRDLNARLKLSQYYLDNRGPAAALRVLESADEGSSDSQILRVRAECYRLLGREDTALALLDQAARTLPRDGEVFTDRAMVLSLLIRFREAESDLRIAEREGSHSSQVAFVRASMAWQRSDYRAARKVLTNALKKDPDNILLIRQLATVALSDHNEDEALSLLENLAERHPDVDTLLSLSSVHLKRGNRESVSESVRIAEMVLSRMPHHPRARLHLGIGLRLNGHISESEKTLEALYHEYPKMKGVAFELARVYQLRRKDASELLERHRADRDREQRMRLAALALISQPGRASAHFEMAKQFMVNELYGRAIACCERALEIDSELAGLQQLLTSAKREGAKSFSIKMREQERISGGDSSFR